MKMSLHEIHKSTNIQISKYTNTRDCSQQRYSSDLYKSVCKYIKMPYFLYPEIQENRNICPQICDEKNASPKKLNSSCVSMKKLDISIFPPILCFPPRLLTSGVISQIFQNWTNLGRGILFMWQLCTLVAFSFRKKDLCRAKV